MLTKFQVVSVDDGRLSTVDFGSRVVNASVAIQGFNVAYSGGDHHVKSIVTKAAINGVSGSSVSISGNCYMTDNSSNRGAGSLDVLVIAECES
ncbi:MAG: hypothetical protein K0S61_2635 [Anaerocolumna sp.]|jgi:hypothetical protein|nr:hypothetical protein [Anaerocolumna sp.]